mgnify:CR=1 FL=1
MIIDYIHPDGDLTEYPTLILRTRDSDGNIQLSRFNEQDDGYVKPHCWIPINTPKRSLNRVLSRYPGSAVDTTVTAKGIDGLDVCRFTVVNPKDLYDIKDEIRTYEADKWYEDQVLLEMFPEKIPDFHPRVWYFDLEWDVDHDWTTVMAVDDTHAEHPVVFAWSQEQEENEINWIDREEGYMLYLFTNERDMHNAFLCHLEECDPDILVAHALMWADLPHLMRRLESPERLSPYGIVTRPHNKYGYGDTQQPIKGRLCFDSAVQGSSGGFESLWVKSGRGQLPSRALDTVATELGLGGKLAEDEDGNKLDVKTWWYTHFDLFVDYCLRDTTLLRQCDEKLNAVAFHVAMQQYCGVRFQSVFNVTNYVRGLFPRYTDLKAPSKFFTKRSELTAAHVLRVLPGRHENVALVDFMSLYPIIILCLNLCPTTKRDGPGDGIRQISDGTYWDQSERGVLPRIIEDMLALRADYKKKMKETDNESEKFKFDMMQLAIKVCTNAIYGYVSQKNIGGMWTDPDVGAAITSTGRESISLLMAEAERQGHTVLAGHTDSCYIQAEFDKIDDLVEHLNDTIKTELELPYMNVEFEAYFNYWTCIDAKNRNFGIITWPESKVGDLKVTGFEHKAANASPVTKEIQELAFRLIGEGAEEVDVNNTLRPISIRLRKGEMTPQEIAPYGRLGKASYDRVPPNAAKGALYYNANINPDDPVRVNDKAQWVYVNGVPQGMPTTNIVSFKDENEIVEFSLDYSLMVEKFIRAKLQSVYDTLGWNLGEACGDAIPKRYW